MSSRAKKKIRRPVQISQTELEIRRMTRNGITPHDLEKADYDGYKRGFENGKIFVLKDCYAAAALAYRDMTGSSDNEAICTFLQKLDHYVTYTLTSDEIIDQVSRELGIVIDFKETFPEDRITELNT